MYPEYILRKLRQRKGLDPEDHSLDDMLNGLRPSVAFHEVCLWEGFLGYSAIILHWVQDIFNVDLPN